MFPTPQAMGEELLRIIEEQRDFEQTFTQVPLDRGTPDAGQLKEHALNVNVATEG